VRRELDAVDAPLVIVTAGGGADGAELFRAYLAALREAPLRDVVSFLVTGPLIDPRALADLQRAAQALPRVTLVAFTDDIMSYFNAADLVIMKGGYNTTCDVLGLGKRALMVPRPRPQEQAVRAHRLAELGLVDVIEQQQLTPARLATQARATLDRPAPHVTLDFGGRQRIGQLLAELLDG
jgi:predicted glycosyltransferase